MNDKTCLSARLIPHPREKVFAAHADPALLTQWWGPAGFTSTFHEFDFRPGGRWRFTFHGPDGRDYENSSVFREIVSPTRIAFDHISPPRFQLRIALQNETGQTSVTWDSTFESAQVLAGLKHIIVPANEQNFDRLEAVLAKAWPPQNVVKARQTRNLRSDELVRD